MTLDEVLETIAGSTKDDWNLIHCWGANCGPSFLDRFDVSTGGTGRWRLEHESHGTRASYTNDVSLGLAYGLDYMPRHGGRPEEMHFEWSMGFPEQRVTAFWVDALWSGMLVSRQLLLSVDAGRVILPAAHAEFVHPDAAHAELAAETVTQREAQIARLVHSFSHDPDDFDHYLEATSFVVVPDESSTPS
jgi:hypothetical protein